MNCNEMEKLIDSSVLKRFNLKYKILYTYQRNNYIRNWLEDEVRGTSIPEFEHTFVNSTDYTDGFGVGRNLVLATNKFKNNWILLSVIDEIYIHRKFFENSEDSWYTFEELCIEYENQLNSKFRKLQNKLLLLREGTI